MKACLDAGFKVTCFDKSPTFGGLWNYHDEKRDLNGDGFIPSVMRTTILNTSKELSAFSDFPPPANLPNYMKHSLYMKYIESYVDTFNLRPCLKLKHEVLHCEPKFNKQLNSIEWFVDVKDLELNMTFKMKFDKLMIAVGHHNIPYKPTFPDQHKFKGQILHSAYVKDVLNDERFLNKRVLVVGFGNSACDVANDLAMVTEKCYLSSHRGQWFLGRLGPSKTGLYDFEHRNRFVHYRGKYFNSLEDKLIVRRAKSRVNHNLLGLTPKHKPSEQTPAINDLFPYRIFTGGVTLKSSIKRFTNYGVIFEGEDDEGEQEVDVVILATGYSVKLPFLNEHELGIKTDQDEYQLYLNMFAPGLKVSGLANEDTIDEIDKINFEAIKSLAFIGFVQPAGSITVVSELQARMATLTFENKHNLPSVADMVKDIERYQAQRTRSIRSHSRDQLIGNWIEYLDRVAETIGVKPNLSKLFFKDFPLWKRLMFGPSVSYQYRLNGPGKWDQARETIMTVPDRVYKGINDGKNHILFQVQRKSLHEETRLRQRESA